jgi:hypothetical protein
MPSVQVGLRQVPPLHAPLVQSLPTPQRLPAGHGLHVPPQSVSISPPFSTESAHVGFWQTLAAQTRLLQSFAPRQLAPPVHAVQVPPPQSTSLSLPFLTKSEQVAV